MATVPMHGAFLSVSIAQKSKGLTMWIVYFWDADKNGVSAFLNKMKFDNKRDAMRFCRSVNGTLESRSVFA